MKSVKFDAASLDDMVLMNPSFAEDAFNKMEEEIKKGNQVILMYNPDTPSEQLAVEPLRTFSDFYAYKRKMTRKTLDFFEQAVNGWRVFKFKRSFGGESYQVSFNNQGMNEEFSMKKDDEGIWKIQAQRLPEDVFNAEMGLHDAIEKNENGE